MVWQVCGVEDLGFRVYVRVLIYDLGLKFRI